jgi:hypothetical protein
MCALDQFLSDTNEISLTNFRVTAAPTMLNGEKDVAQETDGALDETDALMQERIGVSH